MTRRWFNGLSLVSAVFAGCTVILWLATFAITPWDHRVSLTDNFQISVWSGFRGDTFGRLVIFNDAKYGPYRGSIVALGGPDSREVRWGWHTADDDYDFGVITYTNPNGTIDRWRFCDLPGIYLRHFHFHDQQTLWTLMVSLWYPLILFSILPAAGFFHRWRSRDRSQDA